MNHCSIVKMTGVLLLALLAVVFSGCTALDNVTKGLGENNNSGSGVVNIQRVGIDPATGAPVLKNINVWGEFHSVNSGDTLIRLNSKSSPSIFNASAIDRELTLTVITGDPEKAKEYAKQVADALAKGLPSDSGGETK